MGVKQVPELRGGDWLALALAINSIDRIDLPVSRSEGFPLGFAASRSGDRIEADMIVNWFRVEGIVKCGFGTRGRGDGW